MNYVLKSNNMKSKIKFLVMDVDGTLTDGKIYMGEQGEMFKAFDVKDGYGIKDILPKYDILPVVITARNSEILVRRCDELGILHLYQGIRNKIDKLNEILLQESYDYSNCAYIGDDILDLQCMKSIKNSGGKTGCPKDAVMSVKDASDFVCSRNGGDGAVREFIEWLITE